MRFAVVGCVGFVAPRHLNAINDVGGCLILAHDPAIGSGNRGNVPDGVPFTQSLEAFTAALDGRLGPIDYLVICSPTDTHQAYCELALERGIHVICEKPLALNASSIDRIIEAQARSAAVVHPVLQIREHPELATLASMLSAPPPAKRASVQLDYVTHRGPWYAQSWKGDEARSGGILLNFGVHVFDLLLWIYGTPLPGDDAIRIEARPRPDRISGTLRLAQADVRWLISTHSEDLPHEVRQAGGHAWRRLHDLDRGTFDFGVTHAAFHTAVYRRILRGERVSLADARSSISLIDRIRAVAADC
jgi:UDP-N-acetyl-2-amino-2-deoxyglucuronate dehydrogenase